MSETRYKMRILATICAGALAAIFLVLTPLNAILQQDYPYGLRAFFAILAVVALFEIIFVVVVLVQEIDNPSDFTGGSGTK